MRFENRQVSVLAKMSLYVWTNCADKSETVGTIINV